MKDVMIDDGMQRYIGTKVVSATEQVNLDGVAPGMKVRYPDGYVSWCPLEVFDEAYHRCDALNFGLALEAMKKGYKVARHGWNGKDMFIFIRDGRKIVNVPINSPMGGDFDSRSHICMKDAEGKCVVGWLASQTDMLSEDWYIVE